MLAPPFRSVTLPVSQTRLPVPASRQTSSPEDRAENTCPPRRSAVEVLLRTRRDTALVSGQSTRAAGLRGSSLSISPPTSSKPWWQTGVDTASLLLVRSRFRQ